MTSITHAAATSPAFGTSSRPMATSAGRFRFVADSKAVRTGLGVAIAVVLAGDVYAVLRSPVSEGPSTSAARSGAASASTAADDARGDRGFVATNPFSEAAYGADLASRIVAPTTAASSSAPPVALAPPAAPAPMATAPVSSAPVAVAPVDPAVSELVPSVASPTAPSAPAAEPDAPAQPAAPTLVQTVVETIAAVPAVGPEVATVVEEVVEASPVPVSEVEAELAPVTGAVTGSVPSL